MTSFAAQCSTFCPTCSIRRGEKPAQVNWTPSSKLLWHSRRIVVIGAKKNVYVSWVLVLEDPKFKMTRNTAGSSPESQPLVEDVCLHRRALSGSEAKLRHQLGRVLQGVAVSQLTCIQIIQVHMHRRTSGEQHSDLRLQTKLYLINRKQQHNKLLQTQLVWFGQ